MVAGPKFGANFLRPHRADSGCALLGQLTSLQDLLMQVQKPFGARPFLMRGGLHPARNIIKKPSIDFDLHAGRLVMNAAEDKSILYFT
jgi:hypothetical protein